MTETADPFAAAPNQPVVPNRFRSPLLHIVDGAMPDEWVSAFGRWLFQNRERFVRGGDEAGVQRVNWELADVDTHCPDLLAPFKRRLIDAHLGALEPCKVPEFDLRYVEIVATLYHHGMHFVWHDDAPGYDGELVPSRRLTFTYYLHTEPKMFSGGELEFLDGTAIEPRNNRLVLFHPVQQHRVRRVECWSGHVLHGRWALSGWLHGDPPAGWLERVPALRGAPHTG